jgi:hypothetical protein
LILKLQTPLPIFSFVQFNSIQFSNPTCALIAALPCWIVLWQSGMYLFIDPVCWFWLECFSGRTSRSSGHSRIVQAINSKQFEAVAAATIHSLIHCAGVPPILFLPCNFPRCASSGQSKVQGSFPTHNFFCRIILFSFTYGKFLAFLCLFLFFLSGGSRILANQSSPRDWPGLNQYSCRTQTILPAHNFIPPLVHFYCSQSIPMD